MNAIFKLRIILERAMEIKIDFYQCLIDYAKGLHEVYHKEML